MFIYYVHCEENKLSVSRWCLAPDGAPQVVECNALMLESLQLTWTTPAPRTHNGIIQGYKLFYSKVPPPDDLLCK